MRGVVETTSANLAAGYILGYDAAESVNAAYQLFDLGTADGGVGGTVPAALSLTLGAPASFGAFVPGVAAEYTASTIATVISTAGDAVLSVADANRARLANGAFTLAAAAARARAAEGLRRRPWPTTSCRSPSRRRSGPTTPLRTGVYSTTLTFTLSTTSPVRRCATGGRR